MTVEDKVREIPACGIDGCECNQYAEGVCFFHYPLWEYWGYEEGGYEIYEELGRKHGGLFFEGWLGKLHHQDIVNILDQHHYMLADDVIKTYDSSLTTITPQDSKELRIDE